MNVHRNLFTKSFAASLIFRQILVFLCVPVPRTSSAQTSSGFQKDSWLSTVKAPIPGMGEDWGIPSHGEVQKSPEKPKVPMTIKLKRPIWQFCFEQSSRHFKYPFPETLPAWCIYIYTIIQICNIYYCLSFVYCLHICIDTLHDSLMTIDLDIWCISSSVRIQNAITPSPSP